MGNFYTYTHSSLDGRIFYIGKGSGSRAYDEDGRSRFWSSTVKKYGLKVEVLAYWGTEAEAFEHEKFLIWCLRDTGVKLVNLTDGGEGLANPPAEIRALIAAANSGDRNPNKSEEARARVSAQWAGRVFSEDSRRKISEALKGRKASPAAKEAMRAARVGKTNSDVSKRKMSERMSGEKNPMYGKPGTRSGKPHSEETKQKIRDSWLKRKANAEIHA